MRFSSFTTLALLALQLGTASAAPATTCKNPEVRREWRSLSRQEKADWISAVNCLSHLPHQTNITRTFPVTNITSEIHQNSSYYDDFVFLHIDLNTLFHFTGLFLPWHRWFIHQFTTQLKDRCGYTGIAPYWDWTRDAADLENSTMWDDDPVSGLGRWGNASNDYTVYSGGFTEFKLSYPVEHILRRELSPQAYSNEAASILIPDPDLMLNTTFTAELAQDAVNCGEGDFACLQTKIEGFNHMHGGVHAIVGGDLQGACPWGSPAGCEPGSQRTAAEPLFWMHHANLDRMWWTWQHKSPANALAYAGGTVQNLTYYNEWPSGSPPNVTMDTALPNDNMFPTSYVKDVFSTVQGPLCYVYDEVA